MNSSSLGLTTTELIAAASQVLEDGGFRRIKASFSEWDTSTTRLFEDEYSVVGVAVFETCGELLQMWSDFQARLVDVISRSVGREESKSWDGYLVLLTPGLAPSAAESIEAIRYNTTRLRKLVATGDALSLSADVERVLQPLLPLRSEPINLGQETALDLLPKLLAAQRIPENTTQTLVDAFRQQAPLLEHLHKHGGEE